MVPTRPTSLAVQQPSSTVNHTYVLSRLERASETDCLKQIRAVENQFLAVDPRRLSAIPDDIVRMLGYGLQKPFIGYGAYTFHRLVSNMLMKTFYSGWLGSSQGSKAYG